MNIGEARKMSDREFFALIQRAPQDHDGGILEDGSPQIVAINWECKSAASTIIQGETYRVSRPDRHPVPALCRLLIRRLGIHPNVIAVITNRGNPVYAQNGNLGTWAKVELMAGPKGTYRSIPFVGHSRPRPAPQAA